MKRTLTAAVAAAGITLGGSAAPVASSAGDECEWKRLSVASRIQVHDTYVDENGDTWEERQRVTAISKRRCEQYRTWIKLSDWVWTNVSQPPRPARQ